MKTALTAPTKPPTEAEIQRAAYLLWVEHGRPDGRDLEHWFAAKELLAHHRRPTANIRRKNAEIATAARRTGNN